jgi:hypothetical protein
MNTIAITAYIVAWAFGLVLALYYISRLKRERLAVTHLRREREVRQLTRLTKELQSGIPSLPHRFLRDALIRPDIDEIKTKPNNTMERSRILVTGRAYARPAPSIRLAHLRR